jgi:hypothetical protein
MNNLAMGVRGFEHFGHTNDASCEFLNSHFCYLQYFLLLLFGYPIADPPVAIGLRHNRDLPK